MNNNTFGKIILTKDKLVFVKREIRYVEQSSISSALLREYNVYINEICIGNIRPISLNGYLGYKFTTNIFSNLTIEKNDLYDLKSDIKNFVDTIFNLINKFE